MYFASTMREGNSDDIVVFGNAYVRLMEGYT
jgi:hypothetical protein